jgi:hypothetical protein
MAEHAIVLFAHGCARKYCLYIRLSLPKSIVPMRGNGGSTITGFESVEQSLWRKVLPANTAIRPFEVSHSELKAAFPEMVPIVLFLFLLDDTRRIRTRTVWYSLMMDRMYWPATFTAFFNMACCHRSAGRLLG